MKKYIAIGHWSEIKDITSVACESSNMKNFRDTLGGNCFIPYVIFTEERFRNLETMSNDEIWEMIKKMTTNYRKWNDIYEYIKQCYEIMYRKFN